jgi:hypothetical protein
MKLISTGVLALLLILFLGIASAEIETYSPFESDTGRYIMPAENGGAPWFHDDATMYLGDGKDVAVKFNATTNRLAITVPTNVSGSTNSVELAQVQTIGTTTTAPEASDDDQLFAAVPANNTTHILVTSSGVHSSTFLAGPDFARNIIVTPSGSATGSLKLTGTDIAGTVITSNLTFSGAGVVAGLAAFKTVTRVDGTFTQTTPRTLKIGTGDVLGLNSVLTTNTVTMAALNGVREATAPTVTVSSTTLSLNTIDLQSAYSATSPVKIWFFK